MASERVHQVFVSSTYVDLRQEREKVQKALLESECIPVGMELFPPSDEAQWQYIKRIIDQCDYYLLILGGRYGTIDPKTGQSYTEKEYRYAVQSKKPIIAFYHRYPEKLPHDMVEFEDEGRKKLEQFRKLVFTKLARSYEDANELYGAVIQGINALKKTRPKPGWIPANDFPNDLRRELEHLRAEKDKLRQQLEDAKNGKGSIHAIDVMANHVTARPVIKQYIAESLRTTDTVSIKVIAVSLHFTWDFLRHQLPTLLKEVPSHKKIVCRCLMVEPKHLTAYGLDDWKRRGETIENDIYRFIKEEKEENGLITCGRLELSVHQYRNIPHWHGILINNNYLFLGRARWTILPTKPELSVGEEIYRLFSDNDDFGGSDRIDLFQSWFEFYVYSGQPFASEGGRDE